MKFGIELTFLVVTLGAVLARSDEAPLVSVSTDGQLVRTMSSKGDQVVDFSYCGYEACEELIPNVAAKLLLEPSGFDDTIAIQSALDQLAQQECATTTSNFHGWRGALVLGPGVFHISSTLYQRGDHIVLRGSVDTTGRLTEIRSIGRSRRPALIVGSDSYDSRLTGNSPQNSASQPFSSNITQYVATGSTSVTLESVIGFEVGQAVTIVHPSTQAWIESVGMRAFPDDDGKGSWLNWKPNTMDQTWTRSIKAIDGNTILLDAPLTASIDPQLTHGRVVVSPSHMHHHLGVENLAFVSQADTGSNPHDEEHAWDAIRFCGVRDAWARSLTFQGFAGSAVQTGPDSIRVTVSDCHSSNPISELAGWRRHTFFCMGQQALFLRCTSEDGRHDFSTGPQTSGPNAYVYCSAKNALNYSGPIDSWSTGVLYDNVEIDGDGLQLTNRETEMAGSGWVAANCVLWNCVAPQIVCRRPPTAFNLAIGVWGEVVGDGTWRNLNAFVSPDSLFAAQLAERMGTMHSQQILAKHDAATSDLWEADLRTVPRYQLQHATNSTNKPATVDHKLAITNGWLTIGDRLATGKRQTLAWWRGSLIPARAEEFGSGLTRYVPGLDGKLFTNSIDDLVTQMSSRGAIALEHHWGLWYDRRRDDHQMVRRINADAWPPFYEQPWARSGLGRAWDGLSKYDLSRFNPWYFDRLAQFAATADQQGLILMQQMYFQHNVLEAGAHWADFPWRPANCIQDVGFTEPPIYENRKRVFMADDFYDVSHPVRHRMHTLYIRHCLDTLGKFNNVVFVLGEEFSGPTHFVKFWLDTIRHWSQENDRDVLVMLSACRDVQEQVLASAEYEKLVDIIDVKYWWYTSDGSLFDPSGGQSLAPRQQLRNWIGSKSRSVESTCQSVYDLKSRFPEKAVICSLPTDSPWMLFAAGCSLPELPVGTDECLLRNLVQLRPVAGHPEAVRIMIDKTDANGNTATTTGVWALARSNSTDGVTPQMIVSSQIPMVNLSSSWQMKNLDSKTGKFHLQKETDTQSFSEKNPYVMWIDRIN